MRQNDLCVQMLGIENEKKLSIYSAKVDGLNLWHAFWMKNQLHKTLIKVCIYFPDNIIAKHQIRIRSL